LSKILHLFEKSFKLEADVLFYDKENPDILEYIDKRLKPQIQWYENKAVNNLIGFRSAKGSIIILSLVISLANAAVFGKESEIVQAISLITAAIVIAITSFLQLTNPQESWILFRSTAEKLKSEYHLFMQKVKPYSEISDEASKNKLFVERVEKIIAEEGVEYFKFQKPKTDNNR
jgi:Protein of unknown function (DUF4231)